MNNCIFCSSISAEQILTETDFFKVIFDINPVQAGHLLIISKEHFTDIRELNEEILLDLVKFEQVLVSKLYDTFSIDGVTIIENNGEIMDEGTHLHVHLVPRFHRDKFWDNQKLIWHENDIKKLKGNLREI